MVPGAGIEPAWLAPGDFKSPVSTSFTTRAAHRGRFKGCASGAAKDLEARVGIEPAYTALQAAA